MEPEWEKLQELYDKLNSNRPRRARGAPRTQGPKVTTWDPRWISYAKEQIDGTWLHDTFWGTVCTNPTSSNDHIAHVILRQYVRRIRPFPLPFGREMDIPDEVWNYMVDKVAAMKITYVEWVSTDKREMWNRWY
jgi:hypothetical protein